MIGSYIIIGVGKIACPVDEVVVVEATHWGCKIEDLGMAIEIVEESLPENALQ